MLPAAVIYSNLLPGNFLEINDSDEILGIVDITVNSNNSDELKDILRDMCKALASKIPSAKNNYLSICEQQEIADFNRSNGISRDSKVILCLCFIFIMAVGILGNTLVLLTVSCNKSMWSSMHMFIVSLAISDLLLSATCIPLNIIQVTNVEWTFGSETCEMMPFFMELSVSASMLILCCMAVNRYLAIVHPLKFARFKSLQISILLLVVIWIVAALTSTPYAFYYATRKVCGLLKKTGECEKNAEYLSCSARPDSAIEKYNLKWMTIVILFLLPAIIMVLTYGVIVYTLWVKAPIGAVVLSASAVRTHYKRKAIKMLILVFSLFLACWSPLRIFSLVAREQRLKATTELISARFYVQCLALSSTAWNPIVYAFMNQKFRASFKSILLRHKNRVSPLFAEKLPVSPPQLPNNAGSDRRVRSGSTERSEKSSYVIPNTTTKEIQTSRV